MFLDMLFSLLNDEGISMQIKCASKSSFNWLMSVTFFLKPVYSIAFGTIYNMHCTLLTWSNILWNQKDFPLTLKIVGLSEVKVVVMNDTRM